MIFTKTELEKIEDKILAPYAVRSGKSKGRKFPEKPTKYRLCFHKDKARVIHSKAFRRLDEKTQVFTAGIDDHYRTRLTHTLEVSQISRDIARRLGLNEDLCEVIALAHDLGHPPFGHAGEEALNEIMLGFGMHFEHNEQSRRIGESLEKVYPDFEGLNLTFEVLEGLMKHQTAFDQDGKKFEVSAHLEAQVVNFADEIAYINHDTDDGLRSGLITLEQLGALELWKMSEGIVDEKHGKIADQEAFISRMISSIISLMIEDLVEQTNLNLEKNKARVGFNPKMKEMVKEFRQFLYENFYFNPKIVKMNEKGKQMIKKMFDYYYNKSDEFSDSEESRKAVAVKDYIAGMTDRFLRQEYDKLFMKF